MGIFGTAGIRGPVDGRITTELALAVGRAAAGDGSPIVVGWDGRETSACLATAAISGVLSGGGDVATIGMVPTPALAYASRGRHGLMITASHNPPTDNGFKLFADGREYDRDAERRIESRVSNGQPVANWDEWGSVREQVVLDAYRHAVISYASDHGAPLDDLRIVVDCGNGMASLATPQVLRELGASVVTLNATVDGHFPGRESKPTPETLVDLRAFLADGDFDVGIAHDGDADRIVVLDGDGAVVHEDTVLAILAAHYTSRSDAADPVVVTTPNASERIDEQVVAAGGRVERVRLGALHEGIASAVAAGTDDTRVTFAAEPWKHVHPAFGGWIDGVASAAVFSRLVAAAGDVATLRAPVSERPYRKTSVACPDDAKRSVMTDLESSLPETFSGASVDTAYGPRLSWTDGSWVLVRPSGTEPYIRIYAESEDVDRLVERVIDVVESAVDEHRT